MEVIELRSVMELCHLMGEYDEEKRIFTHLIKCEFKYKLHGKELRELIRQGLVFTPFRKIQGTYLRTITALYHRFRLMKHSDYIGYNKIVDAYRLKDNEYDEKRFLQLYVSSKFTGPSMLLDELERFLRKG